MSNMISCILSSMRRITPSRDAVVVGTTVMALGACAVVAYKYSSTQTMYPRKLLTTILIDCVSTKLVSRKLVARVKNSKFTPIVAKASDGSACPRSYGHRYNATRFIDSLCSTLAGPGSRYDVSVSHRETRNGTRGARMTIAPKDLLAQARYDVIRDDDVVTFVDTDYYLSDDELSSYAGRHMLLYSLCPDGLAGAGPDSRWRFVSEDTIVEVVRRGATYTHSVWDWNRDFVVLYRNCCTYLYEVIQFDIGEARKVTALIHARTVYLPKFISTRLIPGLSDHGLRRMAVEKHGDYLIGTFGEPGKEKINLLPMTRANVPPVKIDPIHWEALRIKSKAINPDTKKASLLASDVEDYMRRVRDEKIGEPIGFHQNFLVHEYFTQCYQKSRHLTYQCNTNASGELTLTEPPTIVYPIAPAIVPHAVGAARSTENSERSFQSRLENVKNTVEFDEQTKQFAAEFTKLLIPDKMVGKITPVDRNVVKAKQSRPGQIANRSRINNGALDNNNMSGKKKKKSLTTEAFLKMEANEEASDPRTIQQVPPFHTLGLSCFTYPLSDYMKAKHGAWFMPGKKPAEIARAIRNCEKHHSRLKGGDYSRMDGRTSLGYRHHVIRDTFARAFDPVYHDYLFSMLDSEDEALVKTRGVKLTVRTLGAILSGSPLTTFGNTVDNSFNEYCTRRRLGQSPSVAFRGLGLYYGDDSLFEAAIADDVTATATSLGMKMTIEADPEGSPAGRYVFLSRVYPESRTCDASYPVVRRALAKLTVTTNQLAKTERGKRAMCVVKGEAFAMVNGHVPIIGPLARLMAKSGQPTEKERRAVMNSDRDICWAIKHAPAPVELSNSQRELFVASIARDLGRPVNEIDELDRVLRDAKSLNDVIDLKLESFERVCPDWARWLK